MKEATGELNMTVITVLIIAALGAAVVLVVVPMVKSSLKKTEYCTAATVCGACDITKKTKNCTQYVDGNGTAQTINVDCPCNE